jgi:tetratricopeptide (TPR) repeat protein
MNPAQLGTCCRTCGATADALLQNGLCAGCLLGFALQDDESAGTPDRAGEAACTPSPSTVGRYELHGEIDRGGVGIVYRAWQSDLKREVALKMLSEARRDDAGIRSRFLREAELMAGLDHPAILPVFEVGEQDGVPWYTMKLAEGGSLAERLASFDGRHHEAARLVAALARAIGYAHRRGVLHRDLKPANVVFDSAGQSMITDFGLARHLSNDASLTGFDALIGTPHYVAPEVVGPAAGELTPAVDVYGLGAIHSELLSGQAPFAELAPLQLLHRIGKRQPVPPRRLRASVPPALETVCLRCLEKRPGDRYASADALADALEAWCDGTKPPRKNWTGRWMALPSRRRVFAKFAAAGLATLATCVAVAVFALHRPAGAPVPTIPLRVVAVVPASLQGASRTEVAATRRLASQLQPIGKLTVIPVERSLRSARAADLPRSSLHRALALGAGLLVRVLAEDNDSILRVQAIDALRGEGFWQGRTDAAHIGTLARPLHGAILQRLRTPPPDAGAPASAWLAMARGDDAYALLDSHDNDTAIDFYKRAIAIAPRFALAHARLAGAYSQRSNRFAGAAYWNDSAIEEAERAVRLDPTLASAEHALGYAWYTKGWWRRSTAAYERALKLGGLGVKPELALNYYGIGRFEDSFRLYRQHLEFAPDDRIVLYLAAQTLLTLGSTDAGAAWMRKAIARESDAGKRQLMEAEVTLYRGDYRRCRALAGTLDPELTSGGFYSAGELARRCAERQHDWAAALRLLAFEKGRFAAARADLGNAGPALEEAILLEQLGRHAEAATALAAARRSAQAGIDSGREYPKIWLRMAAVLRLQGDIEGAYRMLDAAFAHGLTVNARDRHDFEFLPFRDDARFAALAAASLASVDTMRARVEREL